MDKKTRKQVQEDKATAKVGRNHEILGMLNAGVSAQKISKEFSLSYSGAKKLCVKLKSIGSVIVLLVLGVSVKPVSEVIASLFDNLN